MIGNETATSMQNAQRLAEVLKRCGMATSIRDAQRMAGEITETEKKVNHYFNEKKEEIHEEMIRRVHPNRMGEEEKKTEKIIEETKTILIPENNEKEMFASIKKIQDMKEKTQLEIHEKEPIHVEPASEIKKESREEEDYITQFIETKNDEPVIIHEQVHTYEKEHGDQIINVAEHIQQEKETPKSEIIKEAVHEIQKSAHIEPHPKTGTNQSIDINEFFNFGKKERKNTKSKNLNT